MSQEYVFPLLEGPLDVFDAVPSPRGEGVYFLRGPWGDLVKIGCSSRLSDRLKSHHTSLPGAFYVACISADQGLEAILHAWLLDRHVQGEWYRADALVVSLIQEARNDPSGLLLRLQRIARLPSLWNVQSGFCVSHGKKLTIKGICRTCLPHSTKGEAGPRTTTWYSTLDLGDRFCLRHWHLWHLVDEEPGNGCPKCAKEHEDWLRTRKEEKTRWTAYRTRMSQCLPQKAGSDTGKVPE